jgi:hypothetical protein
MFQSLRINEWEFGDRFGKNVRARGFLGYCSVMTIASGPWTEDLIQAHMAVIH